MAVSSLGDLFNALRSDTPGAVGKELSPELKAAMETFNRSYTNTFRSLQASFERGLDGLEKKLGEMAAMYEHTAAANSDDARELIRQLLTSKRQADDQQKYLNDQWRELAESYFPQISKEQLDNEIAKRREQQMRMDLLKKEAGISARKTDNVKTEMQLLDSFKSYGKDPLVGGLVDVIKNNIQGAIDERTKVFDELSKQRESGIAALQKSAAGMFSRMTTPPPDERTATSATDPVVTSLGRIATAIDRETPVATARPATAPSSEVPVAKRMSPKEADAAIASMMAAQPELNTGIPPQKDASKGIFGSKGGFVNAGAMGKGLTSALGAIPKALTSMGGMLMNGLGPLGWLANIAMSIDKVLPIFSTTFGALYDVLRMAGPFLASLMIDSIDLVVTAIHGIIAGIDELIGQLPRMKSFSEQLKESGELEKAQAAYAKELADKEQAKLAGQKEDTKPGASQKGKPEDKKVPLLRNITEQATSESPVQVLFSKEKEPTLKTTPRPEYTASAVTDVPQEPNYPGQGATGNGDSNQLAAAIEAFKDALFRLGEPKVGTTVALNNTPHMEYRSI